MAESPENPLLQKIESFITVKQQLESALAQERERSQEYWEEYRKLGEKQKATIAEANRRILALSEREKAASAALGAERESARRGAEAIRAAQGELARISTELARYKAAWAGVLQREKEMRAIAADYEARKKRLAELEQRHSVLERNLAAETKSRETFEKQAKQYQNEVQGALLRLHSSEARISVVSKSMETLQQTKRQLDEELGKLEVSRNDYAKSRSQVEADVTRMSTALDQAQKEATQAKHDAEVMRKSFEAKLLRSESECRILEGKIATLHAQLEKLGEGSRKIRADIEKGNQLEEQVGDLRTEISRRNQEWQAERARAESLEKALANERIFLKNTEAERDDLRKRFAALQEELTQARARVDRLDGEKTETASRASRAQGETDRLRGEMREALAALEKERGESNRGLEEAARASRLAEELRRENETLRERLRGAEAQASKARELVSESEAKMLVELERIRDSYGSEKKRATDLETVLVSERTAFNSLDGELKRARARLEEAESRAERGSAARAGGAHEPGAERAPDARAARAIPARPPRREGAVAG